MIECDLWATPEEFRIGALKWVNEAVNNLAFELHPLLGRVGHETVADLPTSDQRSDDDADPTSPTSRTIRVEVSVSVDLDEVLAFDVDAYLTRIYEMADEYGSQLTKGMLTLIIHVTEAHGLTIDASGRDFFDAAIDSVELMALSFDEDGNPVLPTLVVHPTTAAKLLDKRMTPAQERRLNEILRRKQEERRASRSRPELP